MTLVLALLVLAAAVWYWSDTLRAREQVLRGCAVACERAGVQFLDQTVALARIRLARTPAGRLAFSRRYSFEYSTDGVDRHPGEAVLLGHHLVRLVIGPDQNLLH